ncbi:hypothetical protein B0H19DRAFT_1267750 [Mycena capillaripes]|nr:hypothetical protein B0H19DRAFT_1267750 [Mycena capillaripes]
MLLYDGWQFMNAFPMTIEIRPSLVYDTALKFCPQNTSIFALNNHTGFTATSGCLLDWSPCLMTLAKFSTAILSIKLSKSGDVTVACCASGSSKVWNTATGTELLSTPGGLGRYTLFTLISSDGTRIFEEAQSIVEIWDVETGKILDSLPVRHAGQGGKKRLICAALAGDDDTVVFGFRDGMLQI